VGQRNQAVARLVATEAENARDHQPGLAKQLAALAYRLDPVIGAGAVISSQGLPGLFNGQEPATDIDQSRDGRLLAIATGDAITFRDTTGTGGSRIPLATVGPVRLSPNGDLLVAGAGTNRDGPRDRVVLWNVRDPVHPQQLASLPAGGDVEALAISADGRLLAASTDGRAVLVFDVSNPAAPVPLPPLSGHTDQVFSLAFAPTGRLLASASADRTDRLWDLTNVGHPAALSTIDGSVARPDHFRRVSLHRLAFTDDGKVLATVGSTPSGEYPRTWSLADPRHPTPITGQMDFSSRCTSVMIGLSFSAGGGLLASSCGDELRIWRFVDARRLLPAWRSPFLSAGGVANFRPGGLELLHATGDGVRLWEMSNPWEPGALGSTPLAPGGFGPALAFSPTNPSLLAAAGGDQSQVWDLRNLGRPKILAVHRGTGPSVNGAVAFSPDGAYYAVSETVGDQLVAALRPTSKPDAPPTATIADLDYGPIDLAYSQDGRTLAVADNSQLGPITPPTVKLYDVSDPAHPHRLAILPCPAFKLALSPDSRLLTAYTADGIVAWDMRDPAHPVALPGKALTAGSGFASGVFSPDGRLLVVGDSTGTVRLWRVDKDRLAGDPVVLRGEGDPTVLAFSPDSRIIAWRTTSLSDGRIKFWSVASPNNPVLIGSLPVQAAGSLTFSPDGRMLAVLANGDSIDFWQTDPAAAAAAICHHYGDQITRAQWRQYVPSMPYQPPCPEP
jgi:WD40 repeat protein